MIINYIKTTLRYLWKKKGYTLINLLGLSLGLATCIQIFLFVQDEISYDRYHENAEHIYRIETIWEGEGQTEHWAASQGFLVPVLTERYPEIISGAKMNFSFFPMIAEYEGQQFSEKSVAYADSSIFRIFSFEMVKGDPNTALCGPEKIIMTETTAKKYFGEGDPLGRIVKISNQPYKVSGVIKDIPENTHFHFDIAISMDQLRAIGARVDSPGPSAFYSYFTFPDKQAATSTLEKVNQDIYELFGFVTAGDSTNMPDGWTVRAIFNPVTRIHLHSHAEKEIETNGDISTVFIFSAIAIFILIIACINYMNLATARSARRSREVGLRKVLGSQRANIFNQFMTESFLLTFFSMVIALVIVQLILPVFNDITGKHIMLDLMDNASLVIALAVVLIITTFLAGAYPALHMAGFSPMRALRSDAFNSRSSRSSLNLRRILVVSQFAISVLLIIATITIYRQINFIQKKDIGFDKENVLVISLPDARDHEKNKVLENELKMLPEVLYTSTASSIPGERVPFLTVRMPDSGQEEMSSEEAEQDAFGIRVLSGEPDILKVLGIEMAQGRDFSQEFGTDESSAYILNEAAVRELEIENPVGRRFEYLYGLREPKAGNIVGIAKNFHYASLHSEVEPLMIHIFPNYNRYLLVRITPGNTRTTLAKIEETWNKVVPAMPIEYFFLENFYDNIYKSELSIGKVITYFTLFAVIVACLGLLGLVSFIAEQKTKEIGIRKVLGASMASIVQMLGKEFMWLVIIGNVIAWIPAWYFLKDWLDGFAFSTGLNLWIFVATALVSLLVALLTVSTRAIRAAASNPVEALKYE